MASICEICNKKPSFGNTVSRLGTNAIDRRVKSRNRRMWKPNIQRIRVWDGATPVKRNVCTSCIKAGKVTKAPRGSVAAG